MVSVNKCSFVLALQGVKKHHGGGICLFDVVYVVVIKYICNLINRKCHADDSVDIRMVA